MMSNKNNNNSAGGIGVTGLLGVAFIVLKLVGIINWSWFWVLSPFWMSLALVLLVVVIAIIVTIIWGD